MKTIIGVGRLLPVDGSFDFLYDPEVRLDYRDIPLIHRTGDFKAYAVNVKKAFMGISHRGGTFRANKVRVSDVVNDAFTAWVGGISIDVLSIDHSLPFWYSRRNHADCFQFQTNRPKTDVIIKYMRLRVGGRGARNKGHFASTEIGRCSRFRLFENGLDIDSSSKLPALNFLQLDNSVIGSPAHPIDPERISDLPPRISAVKRGTVPSDKVVIHVYAGQKVQLGKECQGRVVVRRYGRHWSTQDRLDNWFIYSSSQHVIGNGDKD